MSQGNTFITLSDEPAEVPEGPLHGVVLGIKDNFAVEGMRMTCASRILDSYTAPFDATAVSRLKSAGCMILGKNNMDEFACGSSGENSAYGPALNPLLPGRVAGGSSSGSAASVAEGLADAAMGSDTGGSVRCPSAYCSVIGLKPTYGRVSRYGLVDLSMSLEGPAPMAAWGAELTLARMMDAVSGPDARDQTTAFSTRTDAERRIDSFEPRATKVILVQNAVEQCSAEVAGAFERAISFLAERGVSIERRRMSSLRLALPAYYLLMYSEFASAMQRFDGLKYGRRGAGFTPAEAMADARSLLGPEVRRRILLGTYVTSREGWSTWYERALSAREQVSAELTSMLQECDYIAMPTMPAAPFALGERASDPVSMYAADILTVPANLSGIPAGTLPVGTGTGLQLLAGRNGDESIIAAMHFFNREGWKWRRE